MFGRIGVAKCVWRCHESVGYFFGCKGDCSHDGTYAFKLLCNVGENLLEVAYSLSIENVVCQLKVHLFAYPRLTIASMFLHQKKSKLYVVIMLAPQII